MMDVLVTLSSNVRERLTAALRSGMLIPPFPDAALRATLGDVGNLSHVREALHALVELGITGRAAAAWIQTATAVKNTVPIPELVWTGPEVPGLHARDTRQVFNEMLGTARKSIWASTYTYYDGPKAFEVLARRLDEMPTLEVTLLINIGRDTHDSRSSNELISNFKDRLWKNDWPGNRRPRVFFDPRGLEYHPAKSVLHAKAIVKDEQCVFVTSANFTEAALDRNIELGLRVEDPTLALQVIRHYQRLIEEKLLIRIPD